MAGGHAAEAEQRHGDRRVDPLGERDQLLHGAALDHALPRKNHRRCETRESGRPPSRDPGASPADSAR